MAANGMSTGTSHVKNMFSMLIFSALMGTCVLLIYNSMRPNCPNQRKDANIMPARAPRQKEQWTIVNLPKSQNPEPPAATEPAPDHTTPPADKKRKDADDHKKGYAKMFDKIDQNKDGYLTIDEIEDSSFLTSDGRNRLISHLNTQTHVARGEFQPILESPEPILTPSESKKLELSEPKKKAAEPKKKGKKKRIRPPYPTYPPPHSPKVPPPPTPLSSEISASRSRSHYVFTVDNRDVRGKGYRPFVAAANQLWATMMPVLSTEKHFYYYLRSNVSCSRTDCPSPFPRDQQNNLCCEGPVYDTKETPGAVGGAPLGSGRVEEGKRIPVHPSWMDLKGILYMLDEVMSEGDIGIYLDSDAHFDTNKNQTFWDAFNWMMPEFFNGTKPVAIVRDRSAWTGICHTDFGGPYSIDANSGIIMFVKNKNARDYFGRLWRSALVVSPQEERMKWNLNYQFGWPHEQERLSWFASTPSENASMTYIQRMGWQRELPWCFQAICHRNFDKMPYIGEYVKNSIMNSSQCWIPEIAPYCGSDSKLDPNKYEDFVDSLIDAVKIVPM